MGTTLACLFLVYKTKAHADVSTVELLRVLAHEELATQCVRHSPALLTHGTYWTCRSPLPQMLPEVKQTAVFKADPGGAHAP